jgi:hypothetical protein
MTIVVQSTATTSVSKVGMRIDLLREVGLPTEYRFSGGRASASFVSVRSLRQVRSGLDQKLAE